MFELLVNGVLNRADYVRNIKNYGAQRWIGSEIIQEYIDRGKDFE